MPADLECALHPRTAREMLSIRSIFVNFCACSPRLWIIRVRTVCGRNPRDTLRRITSMPHAQGICIRAIRQEVLAAVG